MIQKVFSVYDSKALAYLPPFFSESVGSAVRAFGDAANDPNIPFNKHPGDYQLYEIGSFDNNTGLLTALVPMKLLGCALDFVTNNRPNIEPNTRVLASPEEVAKTNFGE